jgi:nucleotide-binding universal stress UspA family protein
VQLGGASLEMLPSTFPAGAIREYVQEVDASVLALSTRGSTGTLAASTGRTATWIVRESPCPVLVSHPPAVCAR